MPIATHSEYCDMLDRARNQGYAYPAINVRSSVALNAALQGFACAQSDGIIQLTVRSAGFWAGSYTKDRITGAVGFARYARTITEAYPCTIALHTDHCGKDDLDSFLMPLIERSLNEYKLHGEPLFQSYMWDGSDLPLGENLRFATDLLESCHKARALLELEVGAVGGEAEGRAGISPDRLYSTAQDALAVIDALGSGDRGRYLLAATFGNVHGHYNPGNVTLRPKILRDIQEAAGHRLGVPRPLNLVFHGGSGSAKSEITEAVSYGVVKMNIDTDTQYAFTRPIADYMYKNYDKVLRVDGGLGEKKVYDPRAYLECAERGMAARVAQACADLGSAGRSAWANA